ncbi:hypothetical protein CANCADRAFT_24188 [Tortispora caseinolytica NRRL Y-17796]|uniref:Sphingoid long-chain base transporter RSB1 n=1 Tax=Tortispora caseinolytica NRRL Y-17796 TaxID=767744 RepID=A0A1E4TEQ3_9ASCO|nr:hypothetical protein CANCADRAFT_24188 [Tortispora caseinolytica NRRL Y-17796]
MTTVDPGLAYTIVNVDPTLASRLNAINPLLEEAAAQYTDYEVYDYTPDFDSNLAGTILFGILTALHLVIGCYFFQWWFGTALVIGCALETTGYVARVVSHYHPWQINPFLIQIICLTIAPAFMMGGVYNIVGKIVVIYGQNLVSHFKPATYSYVFIALDIVCLILQGAGGGMAAVALQNYENIDPGTNIMIAGIALQVAVMVLFMLVSLLIYFRIRKASKAGYYSAKPKNAPDVSSYKLYPELLAHTRKPFFKYFIIGTIIAVLFIFTRCVYRLFELGGGWRGHLMVEEGYFLVLDGLMLFLACLVLTVAHPGIAFGRTVISVARPHRSEGAARKAAPLTIQTPPGSPQ